LPALIALFLLSSCTTPRAPVSSRPSGNAYRPATVSGYDFKPVTGGYHLVTGGDTLYSIAWRYGLDYRDIARWNRIQAPYVIYPGQRLSLEPDSLIEQADKPAPAATGQAPAASSTPTPAPRTAIPKQSAADTNTGSTDTAIHWHWPTTGRIVKSKTLTSIKGLDIQGIEGQKIGAAADGEVVYSGSGLLGYGKLIIIKHSETYLSAYAHNQAIDVKEGERVLAGQKIATMGKGSRGHPVLHFEIRKEGKPVDPLQYLPARS